MSTIIRNGKAIELTDEEIRSVVNDSHREDVRYEYECAVDTCIEDEQISFATFTECTFAEYASEEDARSDFLDKLTEDYLEEEDMYERNPHALHNHDFVEDVLDLAKDLGFCKTITDHRLGLVTDLVTHQFLDYETDECQDHVQQAVRTMMETYLCNAKFDRSALLEYLHNRGWNDSDIEWFGISDMFDEEGEC